MVLQKYRYDNFGLFPEFECAGKYDTPILKGEKLHNREFIGFNYATSSKEFDKGVHFFLDDYQFARVWRDPPKYAEILKRFDCVMTPDFSLYTDFPVAMQIYNHYRKHALGAYWQSLGMTVIPTLCWSDEKSFDWCFDGEPVGATVAVSSVGTQINKRAKENFLLGYNEMIKRLHPETVIFYGNVPDECRGEIVRIKTFQDKFKEARLNGR